MIARVEWLPVGHIPHGYRRVFVIRNNQFVRHVMNFTPMPYELVYRVREMAGEQGVEDPSLWWGLSVIASLVSGGTLLAAANPETADDGYLQIRPPVPTEKDLLSLSLYRNILKEGAFVFSH